MNSLQITPATNNFHNYYSDANRENYATEVSMSLRDVQIADSNYPEYYSPN